MFVDEKKAGEAQTKADPFTLESLIAWLEKQPAGNEYDYYSNDECLFCQYFRAMGYPNVRMGGDYARLDGSWNNNTPLSESFADIPVYTPHTFGAALARAKALT